jgi:hypothetical protein
MSRSSPPPREGKNSEIIRSRFFERAGTVNSARYTAKIEYAETDQ